MAHRAGVLFTGGELKAARSALEEARRLWDGGSDPGGLLASGRLLALEATLCEAEHAAT